MFKRIFWGLIFFEFTALWATVDTKYHKIKSITGLNYFINREYSSDIFPVLSAVLVYNKNKLNKNIDYIKNNFKQARNYIDNIDLIDLDLSLGDFNKLKFINNLSNANKGPIILLFKNGKLLKKKIFDFYSSKKMAKLINNYLYKDLRSLDLNSSISLKDKNKYYLSYLNHRDRIL